MIGHRHIIEARREGLKPLAIFIEAGFRPLPAKFRFEDPEQALDHGFYPVVTIPPEELAIKPDMRFTKGCRVHLHGDRWTDDLLGLAEKIAQSGAAEVIVYCTNENNELMQWKNGEWKAYAD